MGLQKKTSVPEPDRQGSAYFFYFTPPVEPPADRYHFAVLIFPTLPREVQDPLSGRTGIWLLFKRDSSKHKPKTKHETQP